MEDFDDETEVFSRYFGPDPLEDHGSSGDADAENDSDDLSLNSLSVDSSPRKLLKRRSVGQEERTPAAISHPCPRCVKGTCRLRRHLASRASSTPSSCYSTSPKSRPMDTSTPEYDLIQRSSALGRLSQRTLRQEGDGREHHGPKDGSSLCSSPRRSAWRRGAPDGGEFHGLSPVCLPREDSLDSIVSVAEPLSSLSISGSMLELVQDTRDVRRLIRAVSMDSQDSEYSLELDLQSELGESTAEGLDRITAGLSQLRENCDSMEGEMGALPATDSSMVSSKSSMSGLSSLAAGLEDDSSSSLRRENSIPDLRRLQRSQRGIWKLTNFSTASAVSESSAVSEAGSLEWDSPVHGWHRVLGGEAGAVLGGCWRRGEGRLWGTVLKGVWEKAWAVLGQG